MTRTLSQLAAQLGAVLSGDDAEIDGPAGLAEAGSRQVSFLVNPKYAPLLAETQAAGVVVPADFEAPSGVDHPALIRVADPNRAFSILVELFAPPHDAPPVGVHVHAFVEPSATLGSGVSIGAGATVAADAELGRDVVLHPGARVGRGVVIGDGTVVHANAVLSAGVRIGARCIVQAGAVLGGDGFGFDLRDGTWHKVPHHGFVVVGDDVEIGSNATIDRARFGATRIGNGVKIDNLVMVAHNVTLGDHSLLAAQAAVAGSAQIESGVVVGGQAGIAGHAEIVSGVRLAGGSGAIGSIREPGDYTGYPARPHRETLKSWSLPKLVGRLERRINELEQRLASYEDEPATSARGEDSK